MIQEITGVYLNPDVPKGTVTLGPRQTLGEGGPKSIYATTRNLHGGVIFALKSQLTRQRSPPILHTKRAAYKYDPLTGVRKSMK